MYPYVIALQSGRPEIREVAIQGLAPGHLPRGRNDNGRLDGGCTIRASMDPLFSGRNWGPACISAPRRWRLQVAGLGADLHERPLSGMSIAPSH